MDFLRLMTILVTFLQLSLPKINCEYFTSVVSLETLITTKDEMVKALDVYLKAEAERLKKVRRYKEEYKQMFDNEISNAQLIVRNPISAYLLNKRLTYDWWELKELLTNSKTVLDDILTGKRDIKFPSRVDLEGAAVGLVRLQKMYKLNTSSLANGYILSIKTHQELSADDCYEIGRQIMKTDYEYCIQWMKEALYKLDKELNKTVKREEILEALAYLFYQAGNLNEVLTVTEDLLELVPDHPIANETNEFFISKDIEYAVDPGSFFPPRTKLKHLLSGPLCRGEKNLTAAEESKLKCYYSYGANRYMILQPFKVEELLLDPKILLYHEFLRDKEMDIIISLAIPKLKRAKVARKNAVYANYRISKVAWLCDDDNSTIRKISKRIESATGLTMSTAESMQVLNYGIGGHYEAHLDISYKGNNTSITKGNGERIATWLNYISNVDAGGATVFPEVGIAIKPEKGSAVLWFNLLKNGTADIRTLHTACPVLLGSKWVSNKWIHERGQEFRRKCGLKNE